MWKPNPSNTVILQVLSHILVFIKNQVSDKNRSVENRNFTNLQFSPASVRKQGDQELKIIYAQRFKVIDRSTPHDAVVSLSSFLRQCFALVAYSRWSLFKIINNDFALHVLNGAGHGRKGARWR